MYESVVITRAVLFERFAGRDEELRHLVALRTRSTRELRGGTVSIVGEAGIGKSRLLSEFEAATVSEAGALIRVRCEELPVAYAPFVAALNGLKDLRELRRSNAVSNALSLLTTIDTTARNATERKRAVFDALTAAFGDAAKRLGQLTLVIDDVHWSDLSSLEAMRAIARTARSHPMLLAIAYRAEDLEADHARAIAISDVEREDADRIKLGPLAFADITSLLRQPVPTVSTNLLRRIYELSEGKPYVAEELARSVVERGIDVDPETALTLRSAVLERVAQLGPDDRETVERAAVLGRNFAPDDLGALGAGRTRTVDALRAGLALQIFEEHEIDGVPWFRFRHALTREILYRNLLAVERRTLHLEIAGHLEAAGNRTAELAYHLSAAGDALRACVANERAGDDAAGVSAYGDAARLYARALDFTTDPETLGRVALKYSRCFWYAGDPDELLAATRRNVAALERAGRYDDAIALLVVAQRTTALSRPGELLPLYEWSATLLGPQTPAATRFTVERLGAWAFAAKHRFDEALAACDRAEASSERLSISDEGKLRITRANAYIRKDQLTKAEAVLDFPFEFEGEEGAELRLSLVGIQTMIAYGRGDLRAAFERASETVTLARALRRERLAFGYRCNAAFYAAEIGDFAYVEAAAESARTDGDEHNASLNAARVRTVRALGGDAAPLLELFERAASSGWSFLVLALARDVPFILDGDRERARAVAMRAFDLAPPEKVSGGMVEAIVEFGSDDDVARAMRVYCDVAYVPGDVFHDAGDAVLRARLALREHRPIEAKQHARVAIDFALRTGNWLHLATGQELSGDVGAARATLERIGAVAELARLDRRVPATTRTAAADLPQLTRREEQIARLIAAGFSSRDVAERLAIGTRTVETHLANAYAKLGINSRAQLIDYFAS